MERTPGDTIILARAAQGNVAGDEFFYIDQRLERVDFLVHRGDNTIILRTRLSGGPSPRQSLSSLQQSLKLLAILPEPNEEIGDISGFANLLRQPDNLGMRNEPCHSLLSRLAGGVIIETHVHVRDLT